MKKEIKVPDISENVEKGTIAAVLVSKGDKVSVDQPLVEIETEKASTDIPSPYEGTVDEIKVAEGDEVTVNQVIMIIETEEEEAQSENKKEEGEGDSEDLDEEKDKDKSQAKEKTENKEEAKGADEKKEEDGDKKNSKEKHKDEKTEEPKEQDEIEKQTKPKRSLSEVPAAPSVRRLAREMAIDLTEVEGSGPGGRVIADDVKSHTSKTKEVKKEEKTEQGKALPDFSQ